MIVMSQLFKHKLFAKNTFNKAQGAKNDQYNLKGGRISVILIFAMLMSAPTIAKKSSWAGQASEKNQHHKKYDQYDGDRQNGVNHDN